MLNEIWCGLFVALRMGLDTGVKFQREDWSGGYDLFRAGRKKSLADIAAS